MTNVFKKFQNLHLIFCNGRMIRRTDGRIEVGGVERKIVHCRQWINLINRLAEIEHCLKFDKYP